MAGDAGAAMENLDRGVGDACLDDLADEPRRHRVIVIGDLDVVVGRDPRPLPLGIVIGFGRQGLERRPIDRLEQLAPAVAELAHDLGIEIGDGLADRGVELIEREEAPLRSRASTKRWTICTATSDLRLVARLPRTRREHRECRSARRTPGRCD